MSLYQFIWKSHKWVGILLSLVFINFAVTGILLLEKKKYAWIQAPTEKGAKGEIEDFVTLQQVLQTVFQAGDENLKTLADIDRVDFRPDKRVLKVLSKKNYREIQVDAVTGKILSQNFRTSDLIENWHDGLFFGEWAHGLLMPVAGTGMLFLTISGLYIWLASWNRRNKQKLSRPSIRTTAPSVP